MAEDLISKKIKQAKKLAKRFPQLKGLSYEDMLRKLPSKISVIIAWEMYKELNKK